MRRGLLVLFVLFLCTMNTAVYAQNDPNTVKSVIAQPKQDQSLSPVPAVVDASNNTVSRQTLQGKGQELYNKAMLLLKEIEQTLNNSESILSDNTEEETEDTMVVSVFRLISSYIFPDSGLIHQLKEIIVSKLTSASKISKNKLNQKIHVDLSTDLLSSEDTDWSKSLPSTATHVEKRIHAIHMLQVAGIRYQHHDALWSLGNGYLYENHGLQRNASLAFYLLGELASFGNATAQGIIGTMYATGVGVPRNYAKGLLYMNMAALGGDPVAEHTLGFWYHAGVAVSKDCQEAAFYYNRVSDRLYNSSQEKPGIYKKPLDSKQSLPELHGGIFGKGASGSGNPGLNAANTIKLAESELLTYYRLQADAGDATAQLLTGQLYYTGSESIPRNFHRAMHYFKLAAKQHPGKTVLKSKDVSDGLRQTARAASQAVGYIGTMYLRGEGVDENAETARKWFERGIALDCAACYNGLGLMYREGLGGIVANKQTAAEYFQKAAERDHAGGQINLAEYMLQHNNPNYPIIINLLKAAAAKGHHRAHYFLGKFYLEKQSNCPAGLQYLKSFVESSNWHDRSPELAYMKYREKDYESSFLHYLFAAERGWEVAQTNAAWLLDQGIYLSTAPSRLIYTAGPNSLWDPYEAAIPLWNRAANQGSVDARVKLGDYHYHGRGIRSPPSHNLTASSSVLPAPLSERLIKALFEAIGIQTRLPGWHPVVPDYPKAIIYYEVAAERQFSSIAMFNLGYLYEHGLGVEQDLYLAKRWYDLASSTNPNAYLPANLALLKLACKFLVIIIRQPTILLQWYFPTFLNVINEFLEKNHIVGSGDHPHVTSHASTTASSEDFTPPIPEDNVGDAFHFDDEGTGDSGDGTLIMMLLIMASLLLVWRQQIRDPRRDIVNQAVPPPPATNTPSGTIQGQVQAQNQNNQPESLAAVDESPSSSHPAQASSSSDTSSSRPLDIEKRKPYSHEKD